MGSKIIFLISTETETEQQQQTHTHGSQADMLCRLTMLHSHCVLRLHSAYRRASKQCCSLRGKMLSEWTPVITYTVLSVSKRQHIDPQWIVADPSEHKGNSRITAIAAVEAKKSSDEFKRSYLCSEDRAKSRSSPQFFLYI